MPKQHTGFSFLELPTEIRLRIYSYLVPTGNGYYFNGSLDLKKHLQPAYYCHQRTPQILSTCHQILAETALILYSSNHFSFCSAESFGYFCQKIGQTNFGLITDAAMNDSYSNLLYRLPGIKENLLRMPTLKRFAVSASRDDFRGSSILALGLTPDGNADAYLKNTLHGIHPLLDIHPSLGDCIWASPYQINGVDLVLIPKGHRLAHSMALRSF